MAETYLPAVPQTGVARLISRLIGQWRARPNSSTKIDPAALSDHMQRDLGFRDGRSKPPEARLVVDLSAWR